MLSLVVKVFVVCWWLWRWCLLKVVAVKCGGGGEGGSGLLVVVKVVAVKGGGGEM
jgi:hypothetical protein